MSNTGVQISYNIDRPAFLSGSYRVTYTVTNSPCHELRQAGDVWNGVVQYRGVYATQQEAETAADRYIKGTAP